MPQFSQKLKRIVRVIALSTVVTITLSTAATAFPTSTSMIENLFQPLASLISADIGRISISGTSAYPQLSGEILLSETSTGLRLVGNLINTPPGVHGFHIHEFGSCAEDGQAAGRHYNPDRVKHGNLLTDGLRHAHAGDLGNVVVSADGTAFWEQTFPGLSLNSGNYAVAGRSVILHAAPDDFSQPTGNAGARIGCGTIRSISTGNAGMP